MTEENQSILCGVSEEDRIVWKAINNFPIVSSPMNYVVLILNLFLPGFGTILMSFYSKPVSKTHIAVGLLQFFTSSFFFLGLIWSWIWGVLILLKSWGNPDTPTLLAKAGM